MRILLATDDSEFSEAATEAVLSAISPRGTEVLVAQVLEPPAYTAIPEMRLRYSPELAAWFDDERKQANKCVSNAAERFRRAGFRADGRVTEGEVRAGILDIAAEWRADLIVVGSHGRKGLERFLLGSVAEYVARHARCSVWIVRSSPGRSKGSSPQRAEERG
jgi:nucleotide-binding universal stress UspA family protein